MTINDDLLNNATRHQVGLIRFSSSLARDMIEILNASDDDLVRQINNLNTDGTKVEQDKAKRKVLARIRKINAAAHKKLDKRFISQIDGLIGHEIGFQGRVLDANIPDAVIGLPNTVRVIGVVNARPAVGAFIDDWLKNAETGTINRVTQQIEIGLVEGESIAEIKQRVRGTRAAKFNDGILQISRRGTETMVRTVVNHAANAAAEQVWDANRSVIKQLRWTAVLDGRTSSICQARDGKLFPINEGPRPPAHPNCRSRMTPVLKKSVGGDVPAEPTYNEWLKGQDVGMQNEILGPTRGKLFRQGGLSVQQFVDRKGRQWNLSELKRRESGAFTDANL